MIVDRIEEMRKKSYGERRRTTFLISFTITALIAFVWGTVVLPQTLTLDDTESSRASTASPFKTLAEDVGIVFGDIQVGVDELGKEFNRLWSSSTSEQQNDVVAPASPRDESSVVDLDESSNLEATEEFSIPDSNPLNTSELQDALEEEVFVSEELPVETEVELEIEG